MKEPPYEARLVAACDEPVGLVFGVRTGWEKLYDGPVRLAVPGVAPASHVQVDGIHDIADFQ
jgi:hypothetical protein